MNAASPEARAVRLGEALTLSFPGNPSTGYVWRLEFPSELFELRGSDHTPDSSRIGAPGRTRFELVAIARGLGRVRALYERPWEGTPVERRSYSVRID